MSFLFKKKNKKKEKKKANALYCIGYCRIAATAVGSARGGSVHDKCAGGGNYRSRRAKRPAACLLAWRRDLSRRGFLRCPLSSSLQTSLHRSLTPSSSPPNPAPPPRLRLPPRRRQLRPVCSPRSLRDSENLPPPLPPESSAPLPQVVLLNRGNEPS